MSKFKSSKWAVNITVPMTERMVENLNRVAAANEKGIQLTASELLRKALKEAIQKATI